MRAQSTNNKTAHFVMDGEEFFGKLAELLTWVHKSTEGLSAVPPGTYVRMAYWAMETDTVVDGEGGKTIGVALKELADQGIPVDIILWLPGDLDTIGEGNFAAKTRTINQETARALSGYKDKILVYLQRHPGTLPGQSLHQKIFIASVDGRLQVLVGGFNIEKEYWDTPYHWGVHPITGGVHALHDTAVLIRGPRPPMSRASSSAAFAPSSASSPTTTPGSSRARRSPPTGALSRRAGSTSPC